MKISPATFDQAIAAAVDVLYDGRHAYVSYTAGRLTSVLIDGDVDVEAMVRAALAAAGVEVAD